MSFHRGNAALLLFMLVLVAVGPYALYASDEEYQVRPGDTLYSIARSHDISHEDLMDHNGITDPRSLRVGQILRIPSAESGTQTSLQDYTVKPGDTLYSIARRWSTNVDELRRLNELGESAIIRTGQILRVPSNPDAANSGNSNPVAVREIATQTTTDASDASSDDPDNGSTTVPVNVNSENTGTILSRTPASGGDEQFWPHEGQRYSFTGKFPGILITGNEGDPIQSVSDGRVVYSGPHSTLGNVVFIQSPRGYIYIYGGNRQLYVSQGQDISSGQIIGTLGASPLLPEVQVYFSVWKDGRYQDASLTPR